MLRVALKRQDAQAAVDQLLEPQRHGVMLLLCALQRILLGRQTDPELVGTLIVLVEEDALLLAAVHVKLPGGIGILGLAGCRSLVLVELRGKVAKAGIDSISHACVVLTGLHDAAKGALQSFQRLLSEVPDLGREPDRGEPLEERWRRALSSERPSHKFTNQVFVMIQGLALWIAASIAMGGVGAPGLQRDSCREKHGISSGRPSTLSAPRGPACARA
mmetsp:Transcript_107863/g.279162  ORF Transcript_107863/g.279162 Transcript_107863/m.279162 type:complete len:218 (-) Transcript_107863:75-728(-)